MKKTIYIILATIALIFLMVAPALAQPIYQLDSTKQKQIRILNENYNNCKETTQLQNQLIYEQRNVINIQADTISQKERQIIIANKEAKKQEKKKTLFQRIAAGELFAIVVELLLIVGLIR